MYVVCVNVVRGRTYERRRLSVVRGGLKERSECGERRKRDIKGRTRRVREGEICLFQSMRKKQPMVSVEREGSHMKIER